MKPEGRQDAAPAPAAAAARPTGPVALAIMCKAPRPGRSKTRLARAIGPEPAAALATCFLQDVAATIEELPGHLGAQGFGLYAPANGEAEVRRLLPASFRLLLQEGDDLGVALREGARRLIEEEGCRSAVLINSDSPTLPPRLLAETIEALDRDGDRVVLGPAADGGYVLIGVKSDRPDLFRDIPWSTPEVLGATLARARSIGLEAEILPTWYDVDDAATLKMLVDELRGVAPGFAVAGFSAGRAERTRARIEAEGLSDFVG